ncbi:MAG: DUF348 domain-containing protein [Chloroflexi bacterium]|nr:DUF348 domain-containing protein [Chloroflexota bacterium]
MAARDVVGGYPEGPGSEEAHRHLHHSGFRSAAPARLRARGIAASIMARRLQVAGLTAIILVLALALVLRSHDIHIFADGQVTTISTRNADDTTVVQRAGIDLGPADVVESTGSGALVVRRARSVLLKVDGRTVAALTQASTIAELLLEAGVSLGAQDSLRLDGVTVSPNALLPSAAPASLEVRRAVPIVIVENGHELQAHSSGDTVATALLELEVRLGPGDIVRPPLDAELSAGLTVRVDHARQLTVTLPEAKTVLYTHEDEVGPALARASIGLPAEYRLEPREDTLIAAGLTVRVVGISHDDELETVRIESQTLYQPDPTMPPGATRTTLGRDGVLYRQYAAEYEDGILISRSLADEWYDPEPVNTIVYYSTAPVPPSVVISSGGAWSDLVCSYGWDCNWALAVIQCESGGNSAAYNPAGYVGLFQIWEGHGANLRDPATNIAAAYSLYRSGGRSNWPNCP